MKVVYEDIKTVSVSLNKNQFNVSKYLWKSKIYSSDPFISDGDISRTKRRDKQRKNLIEEINRTSIMEFI